MLSHGPCVDDIGLHQVCDVCLICIKFVMFTDFTPCLFFIRISCFQLQVHSQSGNAMQCNKITDNKNIFNIYIITMKIPLYVGIPGTKLECKAYIF